MNQRSLATLIALAALLVASGTLAFGPRGVRANRVEAAAQPRGTGPAARHPLDALSREELSLAVELTRGVVGFPQAGLFAHVGLREPAKERVLAFRPGVPVRREAFVIVLDRAANRTFEVIVDLTGRKVTQWKHVPDAQPGVLGADNDLASRLVRGDARWQAAMRKRAIEDYDSVHLEAWGPGYLSTADAPSRRLTRVVSYLRGGDANPYGKPIEGVLAIVDLNRGRVLEIQDSGTLPVPRQTADLGPAAADRAPTAVNFTGGFQVTGQEVQWHNWRFRFRMDPREGVVIYNVGWVDGVGTRGEGRGARGILYRASVAEMLVPYGDPSPSWSFRTVFDEGEYGLGRFITPLVPGSDAPDGALYFSVPMAGETGMVWEQERALAFYERDGGLLWRHANLLTSSIHTRRGRCLVLTSIATLGNYDYGYDWIFHQDGTLEFQAQLTGIMMAKGVATAGPPAQGEGSDQAYGHFVAPNLVAVNHQHFFSMRLDFDLEGEASNTVVELNTEAGPGGRDDLYGNAIRMMETPLATEKAARRDLNAATNRAWKVVNPTVRNALGGPVGYLLWPGENTVPYSRLDALVRRRGAFADHHLWVTRYDPAELYPAGNYPSQSAGGEGLPKWVADDSPIEKQDVVVWYTLGVTHLPRPEEWPVMPVHRIGFQLKPVGFFARNPCLVR